MDPDMGVIIAAKAEGLAHRSSRMDQYSPYRGILLGRSMPIGCDSVNWLRIIEE